MSQFFYPQTTRIFRAFQTTFDGSGSGTVDFGPTIINVQWEIYQVTVYTTTTPQENNQYYPMAQAFHNSFLLAWTVNGWKDTMSEFPSTYLMPGDTITIQWDGGVPTTPAHIEKGTASVWLNESYR